MRHIAAGVECLGPLGSSVAGGAVTFTNSQAGPFSCGKHGDYIHMLSAVAALLARCWW